MGEMADELDYQKFMEAFGLESHRNKRQTPIWTTRDGQKIPLNKMTDDHLKNAIKLLKRRIKEAPLHPFAYGEPDHVPQSLQDAADNYDNMMDGLIHNLVILQREEGRRYNNGKNV